MSHIHTYQIGESHVWFLVFHTDINTAEVVKKIQSSNPTKETAVNIREAVLRKQHIRG